MNTRRSPRNQERLWRTLGSMPTAKRALTPVVSTIDGYQTLSCGHRVTIPPCWTGRFPRERFCSVCSDPLAAQIEAVRTRMLSFGFKPGRFFRLPQPNHWLMLYTQTSYGSNPYKVALFAGETELITREFSTELAAIKDIERRAEEAL